MSNVAEFRAHAAKERQAALLEALPNRRAIFERAAERWDEMAGAVEAQERLTNKNAVAKAERQSAFADDHNAGGPLLRRKNGSANLSIDGAASAGVLTP